MHKSLIATLAAGTAIASISALAPISVGTASHANAGPMCPPSGALTNAAGYQQCLAAEQRINSMTPPRAAGPCAPSPGLNQNCGQQSNQPGLCLITGECAAAPPPAAGPPPAPAGPGLGAMPGEVMPGTPAQPGTQAKPVDPGQCGDVAYFTQHQFECAQVAPTPGGFQPGHAG